MAPVSVPHSDKAAANFSAVAWVSWKPPGTGAGVGATGIQHHRPQPAVGEHLAGP